MRFFFYFLFSFFFLQNIYAQTTIPAGAVSGTWTAANSPYFINGNISVAANTTLTIEAGVEVIFKGTYYLEITGRLLAIGNINNPIRFSPTYYSTGWLGLRFINQSMADSSKLIYATIDHCIINSGPNAPLYCKNYSKLTVQHCKIIQNNSIMGGGIYCENASPLIGYSLIANNTSKTYGGGIYTKNSTVNLYNCIIVNNEAVSLGGAIYLTGCSGNIYNCVISNNYAYQNGGGLYLYTTTMNIYNTILWGNSSDSDTYQISRANNYSLTVRNSNLQFGISGISFATTTTYNSTNIESSPLFVAPTTGPGNGYNALIADWQISTTSPCINKGSNTINLALLPYDFIKNQRFNTSCDNVDIGAYEVQIQPQQVFGTIAENKTWQGYVQIICDITVQQGVTLNIAPGTIIDFRGNFAINCQGNIIANGTATDSIFFRGMNKSWLMKGINLLNNSNGNSVFEYCKFENGNATGTDSNGGAIEINNYQQVELSNCKFLNLRATLNGGAIYCNSGTVNADNCTFTNDTAVNGSAIYASANSTLRINNCYFSKNGATQNGSIYITESNSTITTSEFHNNYAAKGGVFYFNNSTGNIYNSLIYNNSAQIGGAAYSFNSTCNILNNNILNNTASVKADAIFGETSTFKIQNSILQNSSNNEIQKLIVFKNLTITPIVKHNVIENGSNNIIFEQGNSSIIFENNQTNSAIFVSEQEKDFRLTRFSTGINIGNPVTDITLYPFDFYGNTRIFEGTNIDAGISEFQHKINVCGYINKNTTWNADTVLINCLVTVTENSTLTILPATTIKFSDNAQLKIKGNIFALGTQNDTIKFIGNTNNTLKNITLEYSTVDSSLFEYCKFEKLSAFGSGENRYGGAIYIMYSPKVRISNSFFENTKAQSGGGAIYVRGSNLILNHVNIKNSTAGTSGGAIFSLESVINMNNNKFNSCNSTLFGGAAYFYKGNQIVTVNSFINNSTTLNGGGALAFFESDIILIKNRLQNNSSNYGGAIYCDNTTFKILNNLITNNQTTLNGGGLFLKKNSGTIANNTITNNRSELGSGIFLQENNNIYLLNNILWGNFGESDNAQIHLLQNLSLPNISYNCIQDDIQGISGDNNMFFYRNIAQNPDFISPSFTIGNVFNPENYSWELQSHSTCLNSGFPNTDFSLYPLDFKGNNRTITNQNICDIIDIGAYEIQQPDEKFVFGEISENTTWSSEKIVICDVFVPENITLTILPDTKIRFLDNFSIICNGTIKAIGNQQDSIYFTVTDSTGFYNNLHKGWSGITINGSNNLDTTTFKYCNFSYLKATNANAALLQIRNNAKVVMKNSTFCNNNNFQFNPLISTTNSFLLCVDNIFRNNTSNGVTICKTDNSTVSFLQNMFFENTSSTNSLFDTENQSFLYFSNNNFINNTINNSLGILTSNNCTAEFKNNILWNNSEVVDYVQFTLEANNNFSIKNNIFENGQQAISIVGENNIAEYLNNIETDPLLIDIQNNNFHLRSISPCVNGGIPQADISLYPFDFEGNARIFADTVDIGVYEYINHYPQLITLAGNHLYENQPVQTFIGSLTTYDLDLEDTHYYSLTNNLSTNNFFYIQNNLLFSNHSFNYETEPQSVIIQVESTDSGAGNFSLATYFTINILNKNDAPTDLSISQSAIVENSPFNTFIGTFNVSDEDENDSHIFTFENGTSSNGIFHIDGYNLFSSQIFNFEDINEFSFLIRATDSGGLTTENTFFVEVIDANDNPENLILSNNTISENLPVGSLIGTFSVEDEDVENLHTYSLANASLADFFVVENNNLFSNKIFNFETDLPETVIIIANDNGTPSLSVTNSFLIEIMNENDQPTNIELSNNQFDNNSPIGTVIGSFTTTDEDVNISFSYSFIEGENNNNLFLILNDQLLSNFDFSNMPQSQFEIQIQSTDNGEPQLSTTKSFTIILNNGNFAPTNAELTNNEIAENISLGTTVGFLSADDPNNTDYHTFQLIEGDGDSDNSKFLVEGNRLKTNFNYNFENQNVCSIRIKTTDDGEPQMTFEKIFTINITDINEPPFILDGVADFTAYKGQNISYSISDQAFGDEDFGNTFQYSANLPNGSALPDWLLFNSQTGTLTGLSNTVGEIDIEIIATDNGGFPISDIFALLVVPYTSIEPANGATFVNISPNPAENYFTLELETSQNEVLTIEIIDLEGKIQQTAEVNAIEGKFFHVFDTQQLKTGLYCIKITGQNFYALKKLVIMK